MKDIRINREKVKVALSVDTVGLFCPLPVVKLKLGLEKVNLGEVVELLADDAGVEEDLPAWCKETGNTLLSLKKNPDGIFLGNVRKNRE